MLYGDRPPSSSSANPHWEEFGSGEEWGYILNNEAREALMEMFQLRPKNFKAVRGWEAVETGVLWAEGQAHAKVLTWGWLWCVKGSRQSQCGWSRVNKENSHRHTNWREERTDVQGLLDPFKDFSSHGRGHCRVLHIGVTWSDLHQPQLRTEPGWQRKRQ